MSRRRRSSLPALLAVLLVGAIMPSARGAAVGWPPSSDLLVSEVVTGGDTAVDEFVELYNAGGSDRRLAGLELVYVSASGQSVTRKVAWDAGTLPKGGRLLVANADGAFAAAADHTYGGGLSASGGSLAVRVVGSAVIDTLSWGSAASEFVEGTPGPAPGAGQSLQRWLDGSGGHLPDTNDNAADTVINEAPVAEGSRTTPVPTPPPTATFAPPFTPVPILVPTPEPEPTQTQEPGQNPDPATPTPVAPTEPTPPPRPAPTPAPTPMATPAPTSEPAPIPVPTLPPTVDPTPRPEPVSSIAEVRRAPIGATVTVAGTVTAQPGRILGERTFAIQDESAGIFVRLPTGDTAERVLRGASVRIRGSLAAPYGNEELRPARAADIEIIGEGELPAPVSIASDAVDERAEGTLVRMVAAVVDVDRRQSGALSVAVRDEHGEATVYIHAPIGFDRSQLARDRRIRVTGLVGQRASGSGAADGHRIWPRGNADVVPVGDPPGGPPSGEGQTPSEPGPPHVRIRDAEVGQTVTISGVVTSKAGVVDSERRRVTVQDKSGAMLVRYPAETKPARVGQVIHATGSVGTWFGGRQLEADLKPKVRGRGETTPLTLRRAPDAADAWRLVRVNVRVTDMERSGDTWRAEAVLGSGATVPLVGLAGSGLDAGLLEPGRSARIIGIVKPAHPSASDQRLGIAPRQRRDIQLGGLIDVDDDDARDDDGRARGDAPAATSGGDGDDGVVTIALASLADREGRLVRVGGRITGVEGRQLVLADGEARGLVRLADDVGPFEPALRAGEIVNVMGLVRVRRSGSPEIIVAAAADVQRAAALGATPAIDDGRTVPLAGLAAIPTMGPTSGQWATSQLEHAAGQASAAPGTGIDLALATVATLLIASGGLAVVAAAILIRWRGAGVRRTPGRRLLANTRTSRDQRSDEPRYPLRG